MLLYINFTGYSAAGIGQYASAPAALTGRSCDTGGCPIRPHRGTGHFLCAMHSRTLVHSSGLPSGPRTHRSTEIMYAHTKNHTASFPSPIRPGTKSEGGTPKRTKNTRANRAPPGYTNISKHRLHWTVTWVDRSPYGSVHLEQPTVFDMRREG